MKIYVPPIILENRNSMLEALVMNFAKSNKPNNINNFSNKQILNNLFT